MTKIGVDTYFKIYGIIKYIRQETKAGQDVNGRDFVDVDL